MPITFDKLWVVRIGNNERIAQRAQNESFICVGWTRMGDLCAYDTREKARDAYKRFWPDADDGTVRASYGQPYRFAHEMRTGDMVVYPIKGSRNVCLGRISGDYRWAEDDYDLKQNDYCNIRPVQ